MSTEVKGTIGGLNVECAQRCPGGVMKGLVAALVVSAAVALAAPARAGFLDRHQIAVLQQVGPTICQELDAQPNPFTMGRWVQGLMAVTLADGWYFLEQEAEEIVFAAINNFCPHHQGLFFQYGFVYGD